MIQAPPIPDPADLGGQTPEQYATDTLLRTEDVRYRAKQQLSSAAKVALATHASTAERAQDQVSDYVYSVLGRGQSIQGQVAQAISAYASKILANGVAVMAKLGLEPPDIKRVLAGLQASPLPPFVAPTQSGLPPILGPEGGPSPPPGPKPKKSCFADDGWYCISPNGAPDKAECVNVVGGQIPGVGDLPPDWVCCGGPFGSPTDCDVYCTAVRQGTQPCGKLRWYCFRCPTPTGGFVQKCAQWDGETFPLPCGAGGPDAVAAGPFDDKVICEKACGVPPPPPPPPPPPEPRWACCTSPDGQTVKCVSYTPPALVVCDGTVTGNYATQEECLKACKVQAGKCCPPATIIVQPCQPTPYPYPYPGPQPYPYPGPYPYPSPIPPPPPPPRPSQTADCDARNIPAWLYADCSEPERKAAEYWMGSLFAKIDGYGTIDEVMKAAHDLLPVYPG